MLAFASVAMSSPSPEVLVTEREGLIALLVVVALATELEAADA